MHKSLAAVALILLATTGSAARPSAADLSCPEAQALVASRGTVVISTARYTYKRFVAHVGYCTHGEITEPAWATTSDGGRCRIGEECKTKFYRFRD